MFFRKQLIELVSGICLMSQKGHFHYQVSAFLRSYIITLYQVFITCKLLFGFLWWSEYCFVNSCTSNSRLRMQFTLHKNISQMHKCININLQYQFWYYGKNNCFWFFEKLFEIHIYIRNDSTCYLWCPPGFCYWPYFIFIVYVAPWLNF